MKIKTTPIRTKLFYARAMTSGRPIKTMTLVAKVAKEDTLDLGDRGHDLSLKKGRMENNLQITFIIVVLSNFLIYLGWI